MNTTQKILDQARKVMPDGVASVNRLQTAPIYFERAQGAELWDVDGKRYIDYNCAFGATIIGHADEQIADRVADAASKIGLIGLGGTDLEVELAEKLVQIIPSADQVAFCNSGSEATFHALRLARAATGRRKIVKFQGAYHGWHDAVALNVGSSAELVGHQDPLSAGMHPSVLQDTIVARYNDTAMMEAIFSEQGEEIAAVIIETVLHNVGSLPATTEFLQQLKAICERNGAVLIFDEVIAGFRHSLGGYQAITGVTPHLAAFGKAMGNGYPIAALVGKEELMSHFRSKPNGNVFLAGTYNGHPVMAAAALATIEQLEAPGAYDKLYGLGARYREDLDRLVAKYDLKAQSAGYGSVWLLEFFKGEKHSYEDLLGNDAAMDTAFRSAMMAAGQITSCNPLKRWNVTLAHTDEHREETMAVADRVLDEISN
ncbi:aspartate aminotransferase family protein [Pseudomaricurvus alkylphenolicus]|uniref:aspartate aminotransferase family protein n=1 Tax=Pseudomaricurvus alkylphenolicus TaxID=1306991 RepID=UPI00142044A5|nr:aspartate aminotransferase family protein [Pseudomaricurvus alkylphenolicus]NIB45220.1 aspartate aminotransferase family protein [Pseudomaricurvus alkylphenolicus]